LLLVGSPVAIFREKREREREREREPRAKMMTSWLLGRRGASGFSWSSTADQVTQGISAAGLTAIVTGPYLFLSLLLLLHPAAIPSQNPSL
jgi:hypothetical protein